MSPSYSVPAALAIFTIAVLAAFPRVGPRRTILGGLLFGTLFLPVFEGAYDLPLIHAKATFIGASLVILSILRDGRSWRRLRFRRLDIPAAGLALAPFVSSLANGLGLYDAVSAGLSGCLYWTAPYLLGRIYITDLAVTTRFAESIVAGGLLYVPLCLWEVRMSPQLHRQLYGIDLGRWNQGYRFGGFRPSVFMAHGLMLAMFLTLAALTAYWLWRTRAWRGVFGVSPGLCFLILGVTTLLAKSAGAIALLIGGTAVLELTRRWARPLLVATLLALPSAYCIARVNGWSGDSLIEASSTAVNEARAGSLAYRMANEDLLIKRALQQPWFGWGGWGRNKVHDEGGRDITIVDGMWIGLFGSNGLVGLAAFLLLIALPPAAFLRRYPARLWGDPRLAAGAALAVACGLWGVDEILNAMPNPLFPAACGGLVTTALAIARQRSRGARAEVAPARVN